MAADGALDDAEIVAAAYAERVRDLFKVFAEAVYMGESERDAAARFRRGLISARRAYVAAIEVLRDAG
ncbi:MAG TPA: hypothetical protein VM782_01915 [Stellaceae bacterium]|nr:hypothetical protein [Stellaceae bacterium]